MDSPEAAEELANLVETILAGVETRKWRTTSMMPQWLQGSISELYGRVVADPLGTR
jgi:hypothetical protein